MPADTIEKIIVIFTLLRGKAYHRVTSLSSAIAAYHKAMFWQSPPFGTVRLQQYWEGSRKSCSNIDYYIVRGSNALQKQQLVALVNHWVTTDILASRRKAALATLQE